MSLLCVTLQVKRHYSEVAARQLIEGRNLTNMLPSERKRLKNIQKTSESNVEVRIDVGKAEISY